MSHPNTATSPDDRQRRVLTPTTDRRGENMPPAIAIRFVSAAGMIGLACGVLSNVIEHLVDSVIWYYAWHGVVPWGVVTVLIGLAVGRPVRLAAAAGLVTQIGLVVGYYWADFVRFGEVLKWGIAVYAAVALFMGPLYGVVGALLTAPVTRRHPVVIGSISAALVMDGFNQMWEADESRRSVGVMVAVGTPYLVLGIVVLCWLSSSWRGAAAAVGISAPLTALFVFSVGVY
jgi:hypothetical protein